MPTITELKKQKEALDFNDVRRAAIDRQIDAKRRKRDTPSPMKLTKDWLTERKVAFGVVEQRIPTTFVTVDFLGCIDLIACSPSLGIVGIQATSDGRSGEKGRGSDVGARQTKIEGEPRALVFMRSGGTIEVWGWGEKGAVGVEKTWTLRRMRAFLVGERIGWTEVGDGS